MRPITFICAYYDNPGMLREQQRIWRSYPDERKAHFHAIVTDDGSPRWPARPHVEPTGIASFRLFRTGVDVRWNWLFCRNLGVEQATTESGVLLTDIDHGLPLETLAFLQDEALDPSVVYRFGRVDAPAMSVYKPHPNSWAMTRAMFDRIGGYDERFSGYYGTDSEFRERVYAHARACVLLPQVLIRYPREYIPDASTTTYGRKEPQDKVNVQRIRAERAQIRKWRPLRVTFPYTLEG